MSFPLVADCSYLTPTEVAAAVAGAQVRIREGRLLATLDPPTLAFTTAWDISSVAAVVERAVAHGTLIACEVEPLDTPHGRTIREWADEVGEDRIGVVARVMRVDPPLFTGLAIMPLGYHEEAAQPYPSARAALTVERNLAHHGAPR